MNLMEIEAPEHTWVVVCPHTHNKCSSLIQIPQVKIKQYSKEEDEEIGMLRKKVKYSD